VLKIIIFTKSPGNLEGVAALLDDLNLKRIDLLPYHRIHRRKYARLGCTERLKDQAPPGADTIERLAVYFRTRDFTVGAGG